nr:replication initiation protein [Microvirus sp.]
MFITKVRCNCLHPYKFFNKYTGTTMIAPCGHCTACSVVSGNKKDLLIQAHASSYKMVAFVTLTFSNDNLPFARLVDVNDKSYLVDKDYPDIVLAECDLMSDKEKSKLYDKFRCFNGNNFQRGLIPYLDYSLLHLFLASLRQSLRQKRIRVYDDTNKKTFHYEKNENYSETKVNYFYVGEYGTRSLRPHFHFLFFFDDPEFYSRLAKVVSKIWQYGSVNTKISNGCASSYLASYVASNVCIPSLLKSPSIRPKSRHSIYFGYKLFETFKKKIVFDVNSFSNEVYFRSNGKTKHVSFTNSFINSIYPKQVGFNYVPSQLLFRWYCCYSEVASYYSEDSVTKLANYIFFDVSQNNVPPFLSRLGFNDTDLVNRSSHDVLSISYFQRLLTISKKFLSICKNENFDTYCYFKQIKDFYNRLNYIRLASLFEVLESAPKKIVDAYYFNPEYALLDSFDENGVALTFEQAFIDSFKHKDINDINQILIN